MQNSSQPTIEWTRSVPWSSIHGGTRSYPNLGMNFRTAGPEKLSFSEIWTVRNSPRNCHRCQGRYRRSVTFAFTEDWAQTDVGRYFKRCTQVRLTTPVPGTSASTSRGHAEQETGTWMCRRPDAI